MSALDMARQPRRPASRRPVRRAGKAVSSLVDAVAGSPPRARGLVPGIAVSDDSAMPTELDAAVTSVSLTLITGVSGVTAPGPR